VDVWRPAFSIHNAIRIRGAGSITRLVPKVRVHVAGFTLLEIIRVVRFAVLRGFWHPDNTEPIVMDNEDITGTDLNVYTSKRALNEKLVTGYGLDSHHKWLKEPGKLFLILDAPLDMWAAQRKVSRRRYSCSDSPASKSLHLFSTRHSGTSIGDRIRRSNPQTSAYRG